MSELKQIVKEYKELCGHNAALFIDKRIYLQNKMNDLFEPNAIRIGNVSNNYGGVSVSKEGSCFFWALENWNRNYIPEEITKEMYDALVTFNNKKK